VFDGLGKPERAREEVTMLEFLRGLFSPKPATAADPDDRRRFASLVISELKLYNEKLVTGLRRDPSVINQLLPELRRAYEMYVARTDGSPEAKSVFREEAVRILANGDAQLLEPSLSGLLHSARESK